MTLLAFYMDQGSRRPQHAGHVALALATWRPRRRN
jgi:hypothetical protein